MRIAGHDEYERAVVAAARAERAARDDLTRGPTPRDPGWDDGERELYDRRLQRWMAASRRLVNALERVAARSRSA